jgi:hypothetical protein
MTWPIQVTEKIAYELCAGKFPGKQTNEKKDVTGIIVTKLRENYYLLGSYTALSF